MVTNLKERKEVGKAERGIVDTVNLKITFVKSPTKCALLQLLVQSHILCFCLLVQVCAVLAGPGLLDIREHSCVCGGHGGSGGLHGPQVLHPTGTCCSFNMFSPNWFFLFKPHKSFRSKSRVPAGS